MTWKTTWKTTAKMTANTTAILPFDAGPAGNRTADARPGPPRQYVFQGVGSRGDVAPLIEIAAALVTRGHRCHVLANAAYAGDAIARGVRFGAITAQTEIFAGDQRLNPENYLYTCAGPVADYFRAHVLGAGMPTVVVTADRCFAANLMAERYDLPVARLYLTPYKVRSLAAPPWPLGRQLTGHLGHTYGRYTLPRILAAADRDGRLLSVINARRTALGLPPVDDAGLPEPYVRRHLALFPDWLAPAAEDWPHGLQHLGFVFTTPPAPAPPALAEFLERGDSPLVFTPGTCAPGDVQGFFRHAEDCCRALGKAGLFLSPYQGGPAAAGAAPSPGPGCGPGPGILRLDYADLGLVLPRASLLVHHGGIGTLAQAVRAGVPQIIVPRAFDQPDNGRRVSALGLGRVVERARLSGDTLAAAAGALLADAACAARLAVLGGGVATGDPIGRCADALEQLEGAAARDEGAGGDDATDGAEAEDTGRWQRRRQERAQEQGRRQQSQQRRTIMFVAWPEPGHVASPVVLARELAARGDRVVFACAPHFGPRIRALGFEHVDLAGPSDWGHRWSLFGPMPGRAALGEAVDRFVATFRAAIDVHRPALVLFDTLYSAFAIAAEAAGVRWALYETDLPRELDPEVPPPQLQLVPDGSAHARDTIRATWTDQVQRALWVRAHARLPSLPFDWSRPYFPGVLVEEFERRLGRLVAFDPLVRYAPLALGPRMVFCPPELDFARTRSAHGRWVGPYIDRGRAEPAFPWQALPDGGVPLVYCAFGTQSLRDPQASERVRTVVDLFARRDDMFLVLACPDRHRPAALPGPRRMLVVERAPQIALLSRASLAITHAGFNSVKECAAFGVPMIALPLSHDQPRNAALVEHRRLGMAFPREQPLTAAALERAVDEVRASAAIADGCARMKRAFDAWAGRQDGVAFIDELLARGAVAPDAHHPNMISVSSG